MEMRPDLGEDSHCDVFKMVAPQSITYCRRFSASHDFLIQDSIFCNTRFCIHGAEIPNHKVHVYITPGQYIGTVDPTLVFIANQLHYVQIGYNGNRCYVGDNTINFHFGLVTFTWTLNASVELKALLIAHGIHLAMTLYKPEVMFFPQSPEYYSDAIRRVYDPQQDSVCELDPKDMGKAVINKLSLRHTFSKLKDAYLIGLGRRDDVTAYNVGLMMATDKHPIVLVINIDEDNMSGTLFIRAFDVNGEEQFTAIGRRDAVDVTLNSNPLGRITSFRGGIAAKIQIAASILLDINVSCIEQAGKSELKFRRSDAPQTKVATFDNCMRQTPFISMPGKLSDTEKKLIICQSILYSHTGYRFYLGIPKCMMSRIVCSCPECPIDAEDSAVPLSELKFMTSVPRVGLAITGHNTKKNLFYLTLRSALDGSALFTLECTPVTNFKQIAKIVGKDRFGRTVFTSVSFIDNKSWAIYDSKHDLIAHESKDYKLITEDGELAYLRKSNVKTPGNPSIPEMTQYVAYDCEKHSKLVTMHGDAGQINLHYNVAFVDESLQCIVFAGSLSFAANLNFELFPVDRHPYPEITYQYSGMLKNKILL